jgi:hypothetical protein
LCVDSLETDIFDPRFDFWVGAAFADALYSVLKLLHKQKLDAQPAVLPASTEDIIDS